MTVYLRSENLTMSVSGFIHVEEGFAFNRNEKAALRHHSSLLRNNRTRKPESVLVQ